MFAANARFLVVDDSKVVRELIRTTMGQIGYKQVDEAVNGKLGLEKIRAAQKEGRPYALVFCDINMPEMDGLTLLENLRGDPETKNLPVLMVTTEGEKQTVIRAVMAGVSGYMVKPFGVDDVKKKILEVFSRVSAESPTQGAN